jgi:hypothetical protein
MPRDVMIIGHICKNHEWEFTGGCNCGCEWMEHGERVEGQCSVPINRCRVCGDYDYGDNDDATKTRKECADRRACRFRLFNRGRSRCSVSMISR